MSFLVGKTHLLREKTRSALASMTPRDRMLLGGTAVFLLLFIMIASAIFITNQLESMKKEIENSAQAYQRLQQEQSRLVRLRAEIVELEGKIESHKNTDLSAFLSKSSQKAGIKEKILDRVKEKSTSKAGSITQKSYNVPLKEVSLGEFTSFLYEIETAGYPFEIQQCSIQTKKRGEEQKLRVDFDIVTYELHKSTETEQ